MEVRKEKRRAQTAPSIRYTWEALSEQFREIARMFTAVEERVHAEGRVNAHELDIMAKAHNLSPLGAEVLTSMVRQSERIIVEEDEEGVWLCPNPEYVPDVEEEDMETTGVRELVPLKPDRVKA